jgi:hypothetical protein
MRDKGDCRRAKLTHRAAIRCKHPQGIYLGVGTTEHTPSTHVSRHISYTSRVWIESRFQESRKPHLILKLFGVHDFYLQRYDQIFVNKIGF